MCSSVALAWRVRNMSSICQGTEAAAARLFHCNRLLPRKRCGLAITEEGQKVMKKHIKCFTVGDERLITRRE